MSYAATISGQEIPFNTPHVKACDLLPQLAHAINVEKSILANGKRYYYLPKQNMPGGMTLDGGVMFDLTECHDFVLMPVCTTGTQFERFRGLNLYGRGDEYWKEQDRLREKHNTDQSSY